MVRVRVGARVRVTYVGTVYECELAKCQQTKQTQTQNWCADMVGSFM